MCAFGWYNTLRGVSPDITKDAYIKGLPAHEVFAYNLYNKLSGQISYKLDLVYQKMAKQKK